MTQQLIGGKFIADYPDVITGAIKPAVGYKLYTYISGSTTNQATYTDAGLAAPNTNPVTLDSRGEASVFMTPGLTYTFVLKTATGTTVWTRDGIVPPVSPGDLSGSTGAGLLGFLYSATYSAGTVGKWLQDLALSTGASFIGVIQLGVGSVLRTIQSVLREQWRFTDFGAVFDGLTDDTAAINKAILAAYKSAANVLDPYGEIYSITIKAPSGKECYIAGKILLPSQVVLDFNGSRLKGIAPTAGAIAYNPAGQHMIETAYYDSGSGTLISNAAAASETVWRVVGAGVKNTAFYNVNCCMNLINFQELSRTTGNTVSNVSSYIRLTSGFYSEHTRSVIRNSCKFAGANAIHMLGTAGHNIKFDGIKLIGVAVGIRNSCTTALSTIVKNCSFETAYNSLDGGGVDGTGILFDTGYSEAWSITGNYIEGIRYGIRNTGGGTCNSFDMKNEFNTTEYAVLAGVNGFRNSSWESTATADGGGIIRNLVDFQTNAGNDVRVQLPAKFGTTPQGFLSNFLLGNISTAISTGVWTRISDGVALAKTDPGPANQSMLNSFAYEGAQILTATNEPPFVTLTRAVNTLTVLTALTYDLSNNLVFNYFGTTDTLTYQLCGKIYGATVVWDVRTPVGCVLTVNNVGGYVQLVFTNLTAAVPTINVSGCVRHM